MRVPDMLLRAYRGVPDGICIPSEVSFQGILLERRISVLREVSRAAIRA
jgi:hypothetical protein